MDLIASLRAVEPVADLRRDGGPPTKTILSNVRSTRDMGSMAGAPPATSSTVEETELQLCALASSGVTENDGRAVEPQAIEPLEVVTDPEEASTRIRAAPRRDPGTSTRRTPSCHSPMLPTRKHGDGALRRQGLLRCARRSVKNGVRHVDDGEAEYPALPGVETACAIVVQRNPSLLDRGVHARRRCSVRRIRTRG